MLSRFFFFLIQYSGVVWKENFETPRFRCHRFPIFFSERARLAPPWPLTSSHLNTASFYYLLDLSCFSLLSTPFLHLRFLIFSVYFFPHYLLFRLCLRVYVKPTANNNELGFFQVRVTLSPVTGRRPDYTIFSVDIGVTD